MQSWKYTGLLLIGFSMASCSIAEAVPTNEIPLYGGLPRNEKEKEADERFIHDVVNQFGSIEKAYDEGEKLAWDYVYRKDYKTAMKRFNQMWLIDPDNPAIYNGFGAIYDIQRIDKEAFKWYQIGAEKGHPKCQYNLGSFYLAGRGVKKDLIEGAKWMERAAEQDLNWALAAIGVLYEYGTGVTQSYEEAKKWYVLADTHEDGGPAEKDRGSVYPDLKRS